MSELLNKETVKRVEKSLREFDSNLKVIALLNISKLTQMETPTVIT